MIEIFADAPQVIQVEWQALAAFGSIIASAILGAAKLVAVQLARNGEATDKRHQENRNDAKEAREENRGLSQAILNIQSQTVRTLEGMQTEIRHVVTRLDGLEGGSKNHAPLDEAHPPRPRRPTGGTS